MEIKFKKFRNVTLRSYYLCVHNQYKMLLAKIHGCWKWFYWHSVQALRAPASPILLVQPSLGIPWPCPGVHVRPPGLWTSSQGRFPMSRAEHSALYWKEFQIKMSSVRLTIQPSCQVCLSHLVWTGCLKTSLMHQHTVPGHVWIGNTPFVILKYFFS